MAYLQSYNMRDFYTIKVTLYDWNATARCNRLERNKNRIVKMVQQYNLIIHFYQTFDVLNFWIVNMRYQHIHHSFYFIYMSTHVYFCLSLSLMVFLMAISRFWTGKTSIRLWVNMYHFSFEINTQYSFKFLDNGVPVQ